jgi:hypothetical protein
LGEIDRDGRIVDELEGEVEDEVEEDGLAETDDELTTVEGIVIEVVSV